MKHLEIERRYLLYPCSAKRLLKQLGVAYESIPMKQFYLVADEERTERYRQEGPRYVLTRKQGRGLTRVEEEWEIDRKSFEEALAKNRGGLIEKRRYVFEMEGRRYELDSFKKGLKGLNILEVEFSDVREAERFRLPEPLAPPVVAEVTENPSFTNGAISRTMRIPALESDLARLLAEVSSRKSFLKASTQVPLHAYESGAHAVKALLFSLLNSVEANRKAMLSGDDDPERLHQFRVAMRKQRALLSQLAPLFDPDWAGAHREKLAALMRRTGAKRDIDVYLLQIPYYRSLLPEKHHEGLEKLAEYLKTKEREARQALRDFLESAELTEELEALARFCRRDDGEGLRERAAGPVVLEVKKALRRRYDRVLKKGAAIDARSEAEAYHRVRIDVKKLRYLMEFFAAIFETEAYREMLGKLKSIQTILGEHQDLDVQRSHLKAFASLDALHDAKTREAIAVLRETMAKLEERKRKEFRDAFVDFSETSGLLKRMVCHY